MRLAASCPLFAALFSSQFSVGWGCGEYFYDSLERASVLRAIRSGNTANNNNDGPVKVQVEPVGVASTDHIGANICNRLLERFFFVYACSRVQSGSNSTLPFIGRTS